MYIFFFSVMPNEIQTVQNSSKITEPLSTEPGMFIKVFLDLLRNI